jgi:Calcineurin-like phosphoesterase
MKIAATATVGITFSVAVCCGMASATAASRDWSKYPAVLQVDTKQDVFAISDPHADLKRLRQALLAAGLIDKKPSVPDQVRWAGGKSVLVIVGDLIDKGDKALEVIALLRALQSDAIKDDGRVIILMGNHEAEFLASPDGEKTEDFFEELEKAGQDPTGVANCNGELGQFLCNMPIAIKVNDWFFSHAGNTKDRTIAALSDAIKAGFKDGRLTYDHPITGFNSILEARLNDKGPNGLPWIYNGDEETDPQKLLTDYDKKLGVKHLVQGHQAGNVKFRDGKNRDKYAFFQRYYGLLFLIDTGMSRGQQTDYGNTGGVLRIISGELGDEKKAIIICAADHSKTTLWDEKMSSDHKEKQCRDPEDE